MAVALCAIDGWVVAKMFGAPIAVLCRAKVRTLQLSLQNGFNGPPNSGYPMALTTEQKTLIEQRVANDGKSMLVAYLLAIFFGGLGLHRFYLGHNASAALMLVLFILGCLTTFFIIGLFMLAVVGIWVIIDLFLIPAEIVAARNRLRKRLTEDMEMGQR